jgi:hypothetical protein
MNFIERALAKLREKAVFYREFYWSEHNRRMAEYDKNHKQNKK